MHETEPSRGYSLDDLPALELLEAACPNQGLVEAMCGDLDDSIMAGRVPGGLIGTPTTSEAPRVRALCTLAGRGDPDMLREITFGTLHVPVLQVLASNPATPLDALEHLASLRKWGIAYRAAANPGMPVWMLDKLYSEGECDVRKGVLSHPRVPGDLVDRAAADPDVHIRCSAARAAGVSAGTLTLLSADPEEQVRGCVAGNPATPLHLVERLIAEAAPSVLLGALNRPSMTGEMFDVIVERAMPGPGTWWVLYHAAGSGHLTPEAAPSLAEAGFVARLAANPRTPADLLERFGRRGGLDVRLEVARNPSCPTDLRIHLANHDRSRDVRENAATLLPLELRPELPVTPLDLAPGVVVEHRGLPLADRYQLVIQEVGETRIFQSRYLEEEYLKVTLTGVRRRIDGRPSRRYPAPVTVEVFMISLRVIEGQLA